MSEDIQVYLSDSSRDQQGRGTTHAASLLTYVLVGRALNLELDRWLTERVQVLPVYGVLEAQVVVVLEEHRAFQNLCGGSKNTRVRQTVLARLGEQDIGHSCVALGWWKLTGEKLANFIKLMLLTGHSSKSRLKNWSVS